MIEIETAQQILVGLTLAAVDRHRESRNGFEQLSGAERRELLDFLRQNDSLAGRLRNAEQFGAGARDDDLLGHSFGGGGRFSLGWRRRGFLRARCAGAERDKRRSTQQHPPQASPETSVRNHE